MMKISEIYQLAVQMGRKVDPRSSDRIDYLLKQEKKRFLQSPKDKYFFDQERLTNPYSDTRFFNSDGEEQIKKVLAGIDIDTGEVLLADRLGKIDLIIAHHPLGSALARLDDVIHLQADLLASLGVPINVAENLTEKRVSEVSRKFASLNHYKAVDAAKLLKLPIMCVHTPADNLVYGFVKNKIDRKKPQTLEDLIGLLNSIEEYKIASSQGAGPTIISGKPHRRVGKIALSEITGGASGAKEIYERLAQYGIGTIISMHMHEEYREEALKHHINVIIAGHIASDSLGLNLFLDQLEKHNVQITPTSGLIRVKRS